MYFTDAINIYISNFTIDPFRGRQSIKSSKSSKKAWYHVKQIVMVEGVPNGAVKSC